MRFLAVTLILVASFACERKPTEEELAQQREVARANATPTPRPALTKERLKDYKNPLEKNTRNRP
jgi:hypothetical protein